MPEPVIHDVHRALMEEQLEAFQKAAQSGRNPNGTPGRPGEILRAFAFDLDPEQTRTDMRQWATFTHADRLRRARLMVQFPDPVTGVRDLMYVIWSEGNAALRCKEDEIASHREVAAIAFNGMFPQAAKKPGK